MAYFTLLTSSLQTTQSLEDASKHVDLNRNVEALCVQSSLL